MNVCSASIIITTFNRAALLKRVLTALEAQRGVSHDTYEVIVVSDGSTDETEAMVHAAQEQQVYSFRLVYANTHLTSVYGLSAARNHGIRLAQGDTLFFLDDDCIPHELWLHSHRSFLQQQKRDVVVGHLVHSEDILGASPPFVVHDPTMQRLQELSKTGELTELLGGNCVIQKYCFERAGVYDERFIQEKGYGYEDVEFGHRLIIAGYRFWFNPDAVVYAPPKSESLSEERIQQKKEAKLLWWHIIMNPQKNLPITKELCSYAEKKKEELALLRAKRSL